MHKIGNTNNATVFASLDQRLSSPPTGFVSADQDITGVDGSSLFHNVSSTDNLSGGYDQSPFQNASSTADNLAIDPTASRELNLDHSNGSGDYADTVGTFNGGNSIADSFTAQNDSAPLAPTFLDNLSDAPATPVTHVAENQDGELPLNIQFNQDVRGQPDHTNPIINAAFQDSTFLNDAASTSADHLTFVRTGDGNLGTANASHDPAPIFSYDPTPISTNDAVNPVTNSVSGPGTLLLRGDVEAGTTGTPQVVTSSSGSSSMAGGSQSSGLIINVSYDASVANAPAAFKTDVAAAVQYFESQITNPISININVGYGEVNGMSLGSGSLGSSMYYIDPFAYSQVKNALVADATSANDMTATAALPSSDPTNGGTFYLSTANAKALGLLSGSYTDGYAGFSSSLAFDYNNSDGVTAGQYDFMGTVMHEISEVLGRETEDGQSGQYTALDLFHYSASGVRDLNSGTTPGYFSVNGGQTNLNNFNTNSGGDFGDWAGSAGNDAALAFASPGVVDPFSAADLTAMDVIGWNLAAKGPAAPTVASFSPDTGVVGDGITNATMLSLAGTATANSTVNVYDGATLLGTAAVNSSGAWGFTTGTLASGSHSFTATDTVSGTTSAASSALNVTVDTTAPSETISSTIGTNTGSTTTIASGGLTNDNTLALSGTVSDANGVSSVQIYDGATLLGTATVNAGSWSYTTAALADGSHNFTAKATDTAGNTTTTAAVTATVDATVPSETISSTIGTNTGSTTTIASGGLTNDNTLALSGTVSDANGVSSVQIYDGATLLGTATVNAGSWSYTTAALADGSHNFTAKATDTAGNTTTTAAVTATVDTTAPSETISSTIGTNTGSTTTIASGGLTNDNTLALSGTVSDANGVSSVQIYDGATLLGTATVNAGSWSYTTAALADGSHNFTAKATDTAGNTTTTAAVTATVDTTAPVVSHTSASPSTGIEYPGNTVTVTLNLSEVVTVTGAPTLTLNDGGRATYTGGSGTNALTFSYTVGASDSTVSALVITAVNLPNGATVTDSAGNTANLSGALTTFPNLQIDPPSSAPVIGSFSPDTGVVGDGITNATVLSLAGTATANSTVNVYDGATLLGTAAVNSSGAWGFTTGTLASGSHSFTATDTVSGTTSAASSALNVTVDTTAPSETISSTIGTNTGSTTTIASGGLTNDNTLALSGTVSDANGVSSVQIYDGATLLGTATVNAGSWSYTTAALADGSHSFTAKATDTAGNTTTTAAVTATVDTTATVIEAYGSTVLTEVTNHYYLDNSSGSGPSLKYGGADFVAAQFGGWTPIGAEQTASGYEVAWKMTGADQYTVWNTDSNGNYISNAIVGAVSGTSTALESLETSFHQDLNGDGVIGVPTTVIEAYGSTVLTEVTNHYYLDNSSGSGPSLKYGGADFVAGQFGGWTPIGAEQTASGYEVAWKVAGADQYTVWNTDSNGNYISNAIVGAVLGTSTALESLETSFHQDLNGDGVIGVPTTVISTDGSIVLTEVENHYYLDNSSGSGPSLKYGGADFVAGQFGGWTPIGAEQTASGYEVAWKVAGADQYTVWNTDSNGNYISNAIVGGVLGTSTALESLETSFHQDLNGDGVIGVPTTVIEAYGSTVLTEIANSYYLENSSGSGPSLKYGGADFVTGQFGGWTPIGAEQTASGYEVAWKMTGADQYTVWNTDSNGNYISNAIVGAVSGTSTALESLETSFHQDLNGDGMIGVPTSSQSAQNLSSLTATATDGAGNTDTTSSVVDVTIDAAIAVTPSSSGSELLAGSAEPNSAISIYDDNAQTDLGQTTTDSSGAWSVMETLSNTVHSLTATASDQAGRTGSVQVVIGTTGNDTITSGAPNEILFGNGGANTFVFSGNNIGKDTIADFQSSNDVLQLSHNVFSSFADVLAHATQVGSDVTIAFDSADSVTLHNTILSHLTTSNVHLV